MFLDKDSFFLENLSMGPYLTEIEYGHHKLWAEDTGRNLKGKNSGTFLGIVYKFKLSFRRLTQEELELLTPILDSAWQHARYYNPKTKRMEIIETYTGDWETLNRNTFSNVATANEPFDISVIDIEPRLY